MSSAIFWTLMVVVLNTPQAAVDIYPVSNSPAFQTRTSCEEYAKLKSVQNTVCFTGGARLSLWAKSAGTDVSRDNVRILQSDWSEAR